MGDPGKFAKRWDKHDGYAKDQNIAYPVASLEPRSLIAFKVTQSGAAPAAVDLAALGYTMADANYVVQVTTEGALTSVDESTITESGFDILGGLTTEVHHVTIVGRLATQPAE